MLWIFSVITFRILQFEYNVIVFSFLQELEETEGESVLESEVLVDVEDTETGPFSSRLFELEDKSVENQDSQETNHNNSAAEAFIPAESEDLEQVGMVGDARLETQELQTLKKPGKQDSSSEVLPAGKTNADTAECRNDKRPTNDNPDEEGDSSFSNKSSCQKPVVSTADLDEMMDMGIVEQIDQEAQMKEEEQRSLDSQSASNSSKGTRKHIYFRENKLTCSLLFISCQIYFSVTSTSFILICSYC